LAQEQEQKARQEQVAEVQESKQRRAQETVWPLLSSQASVELLLPV
jgi:hypothetical protein